MNKLLLGLCLLVLLPAVIQAQEEPQKSQGQGYVFVAPGGYSCSRSGTLHFGGGGEGVFSRGLGFGAEIGYVGWTEELGSGFGLLSLNGLYQIPTASPSQRVVPFMTGGYSLGFRTGAGHGFNLGGGIHYWFREAQGLRIEFRDHVFYGCHLWQFRFGIEFR